MKKIILATLISLTSYQAIASTITTCEDKNDFFNEVNYMMIRETSKGDFKLLGLAVNRKEYLPEGSIYCDINTAGPIGGIRNSKEITCELPSGEIAQVRYQEKGIGSVAVFKNNRLVSSFSNFECY